MPFQPQDIINQTNQYRAVQKLPPLKADPQLMQAAQARATDMAKTGVFSHEVSTTTGDTQPWQFVTKAGYQYQAAGENLAANFNTATDTMTALKNSPLHNKNLIDPRFTDTGVALVPATLNGKSTYFVVQFFGSKPPKVQPQTQTVKSAMIPAKPVVNKPTTFTALGTFDSRIAHTTKK